MSSDPPKDVDPILLAAVERNLTPYKGRVPPAMLKRMRREAIALCTTHPYPAALLEQLNAKAAVRMSHDRPKEGASPASSGIEADGTNKAKANGGRGGGRR